MSTSWPRPLCWFPNRLHLLTPPPVLPPYKPVLQHFVSALWGEHLFCSDSVTVFFFFNVFIFTLHFLTAALVWMFLKINSDRFSGLNFFFFFLTNVWRFRIWSGRGFTLVVDWSKNTLLEEQNLCHFKHFLNFPQCLAAATVLRFFFIKTFGVINAVQSVVFSSVVISWIKNKIISSRKHTGS